MEGNSSTGDRVLWVAVAVAAGLAAGTAAAVTATAFPYAFGAAFTALQSKRKKEHREHRHRHKSDKVKRPSSKPKQDQAYRDAIRRSIFQWEEIDVTLEGFPYFLKYVYLYLVNALKSFFLWEIREYINLESVSRSIKLTRVVFLFVPVYWVGAVIVQRQHW
jgi:hypothetical protein